MLVAVATAGACGDNQPALDDPIEPRTVGDHVRTDPRLSEFRDMFNENGAADLRATPLLGSLDDGASITLFAPTNSAIRELIREFGIGLLFDVERLRKFLRYHVHDGRLTIDELKSRTAITTRAEPDLHIRYGVDGVKLNDGAKIIFETIIADNGVIHIIDAPLRRPLVTETSTHSSAPGLPLVDATPDFQAGFTTDAIVIPDAGQLHDLRISLEIEHSRVADLFVFANHQETGTFFPLARGPQTFQADIRTTFADSADFDVIDDIEFVFDPDSQAFPEDAYRPDEAFEFLLGESISGTWTLFIIDVRPGETGVLHEWAMTVTRGDEDPGEAIGFARVRANVDALGAGFNESTAIGVARIAGLAEPIEVRGTLGDLASSPVELAGLFENFADLVFRLAADAPTGPRDLEIVAETATGISRIKTVAANVVEPENDGLELLAHIPLAELEASDGNDVWGWTDESSGREYVLMGTSANTTFVDISEPTAPVILGMLPSQTDESQWRDIKVYADHAYVVSEATNHGLQVFDLTQLRGLAGPQTFAPTAHNADFGNAHNIVIDEESAVAYVVGATDPTFPNTCAGGLMMFDLATPTDPQFVGCFAGGVPARPRARA